MLRSRRIEQFRHRRFPDGPKGGAHPADIAGAGHDDPHAPEPTNLTGTLIGYSRLSMSGQNLDRQTRTLTDVGCIRVFASKLPCRTGGASARAAAPGPLPGWVTTLTDHDAGTDRPARCDRAGHLVI